MDPHHSSRGYQITGDTIESIAEVLWQWFMHTVYNPSGFFDMTPYPLIHRFTLADIGFELPQLFNPEVWMREYHMCVPDSLL